MKSYIVVLLLVFVVISCIVCITYTTHNSLKHIKYVHGIDTKEYPISRYTIGMYQDPDTTGQYMPHTYYRPFVVEDNPYQYQIRIDVDSESNDRLIYIAIDNVIYNNGQLTWWEYYGESANIATVNCKQQHGGRFIGPIARSTYHAYHLHPGIYLSIVD